PRIKGQGQALPLQKTFEPSKTSNLCRINYTPKPRRYTFLLGISLNSGMVRWFCPFCWKEISEKDKLCPHCGRDLEAFHRLSYEDKLLLGLDNPITQRRMFEKESKKSDR
ncbi:MAG: hypothetical protein ACK4OF_08210, partial [Aquificaceae bacterium]